MDKKGGSLALMGRSVPMWMVALLFVSIGLLAYFPYLTSGFCGDDFIFINMLEGAIPYNPWLGFWAVDIEDYPGFTSLWWMEAGVQGAFLRPLSSWVMSLLFQLFGRNAVPFHFTLLVIHSLAAFSGFLLLRRLSGHTMVSMMAALLFLICEDHGMTVAWIATMTDLLCALFLNLAFLSHVVARQERRPWLLGVSLGLFLMAITSKETAAIYPAMIMAYEFFFAGQLSLGKEPLEWRTRLRLFARQWPAWGIPLLLLLAYMFLYRSLIPPMRSLMYTDPFRQPGRYLQMAVVNLPVMFVGLLTQFLPSLVIMLPETVPYVVAGGGLLIILLLWALLPYRQERIVWFALVLFVLGLLPGLAAEVGERLLYLPSLFGLYVVAWLILQIPRVRGKFTPGGPSGVPVLGSVWGWYLLVSTAILPLILLFVYPSMWIPGLQLTEQTMLDSLPLIDQGEYTHVVYLNSSSSFNTFYLADIYRYHRDEALDLRLLSSFNGHVWARQVSQRELMLKTDNAGWLDNMFARTLRITPLFDVGDAYHTTLFKAVVQQVTAERDDVLQVSFEFELPLDDPSLLLLVYDGQEYRRWEPSTQWKLLNPTLDPLAF